MWDLSTNRYMKTLHEDIRGSIILIPQMQLTDQVYGRSVDATFKAGEPRELYILLSTVYEIKRFFDRKDFCGGLKIRKDRSIVPTCGTYAKLEQWPNKDHEDNQLLMKVLRAQVIFKQEFLKFTSESLVEGSSQFHPRGFRAYVRDRADQTQRRSIWRFRAMKKSFKLWLDNLGPIIINRLCVSILYKLYFFP